MTTHYPEQLIYFPKYFINIIPKCQGIRICDDDYYDDDNNNNNNNSNNNTHVISEQNRIRFV